MVDRWYLPITHQFNSERPRTDEVEEFLASLSDRYSFQDSFWPVFWSRVAASSLAAYTWGIEFGVGNRIAESAQIAAFFADVSYPVLASNEQIGWSRLLRYCRITGAPLRRYEIGCIDARHNLASGLLCRDWGLHDDIVRAVETHHRFPSRREEWTASDCVFFGQAVASILVPNLIPREAREWTVQTLADVAGVAVGDVVAILGEVSRGLRLAKKRLKVPEFEPAPIVPTEGWTAGRCLIEAWDHNSAAQPANNLRHSFQELRHLLPSGLPNSEQLLYQPTDSDEWVLVGGRFSDSGIHPGDPFRLDMGIPTLLTEQTNAAREVWAVRLPTASARQAVYLAIYDHETAQRKPHVKSIHRALGAGGFLEAKFVEARYVEHFSKTLASQRPDLYERAVAMANWSVQIAQEIGLGVIETEVIKNAAMLREIGDIGVTTTTESNTLLDEARPMRSSRMLRQTLPEEAELVASQYERWDGAGFPVGMKGKQIPIGSRIIGVAEAMAIGSLDRTKYDPEIMSIALDLSSQAA